MNVSKVFRQRRAFTIAEIVLVITVLAISAGVSIPMYNRYIARNSMEIARQNIAQGLERAKLLSQIGMNDSTWGFSTDAIPGRGVLFMGDSFVEREPSFDELYSIPENLTLTGLSEVVFEKITGIPNRTGEITIFSPYNDSATVTVSLGATGEVDVPEDWLEICIDPYGSNPQTISVPDSLWITYQENGALLGSCGQQPPVSSSSSSASEAGGSNFSIVDGTITIHDDYRMRIDKVGAALNISSGYAAPITIRYKIDGPYLEPWGDFEKPVDGNINTEDQDFTYTTEELSDGTTIDVWANSYYKKKSWYDGSQNNHFNLKQHVKTPVNPELIKFLVNGDEVPTYEGAGGQPDVEEFLEPYIDADTGLITLPDYQALFLFELWTTDTSHPDADFQDLVLLITFLEP